MHELPNDSHLKYILQVDMCRGAILSTLTSSQGSVLNHSCSCWKVSPAHPIGDSAARKDLDSQWRMKVGKARTISPTLISRCMLSS